MNNFSSENNRKQRLFALDEIRGIAIILMVLYHMLYYMTFMFPFPYSTGIMRYAINFEPVICSTFILLCGLCSVFSRSNIKRGLKLLAVSAAITIGSIIIVPDFAVYFGILHFLSVATIFFGLLNKPLAKAPVGISLALCAVLFIFTYGILYGYVGIPGLIYFDLPKFLTSTDYLFMFGFRTPDFVSSDYFPIFPWIFLFLFGSFLGFKGIKNGFPAALYKKRCTFLAFLGRHSLIIYIVHIPIVYGLVYLLYILFIK